ncbi:MAG: PilN domain-containing protein [Candidatus Cloacimonetes bacterium]|nr:PilN domain-containing protein [Candidatus Cloacimonadota bacterium]
MKFYFPYLVNNVEIIQLNEEGSSYLKITKLFNSFYTKYLPKFDSVNNTGKNISKFDNSVVGIILPLSNFDLEIADSPDIDDEAEFDNWIQSYFIKNIHDDTINYVIKYLLIENEIEKKILIIYTSVDKISDILSKLKNKDISYLGCGLENFVLKNGIENNKIANKDYFILNGKNKLIIIQISENQITNLQIFPASIEINDILDEAQKQSSIIIGENQKNDDEINASNLLSYCTSMNILHNFIPAINFLDNQQIEQSYAKYEKKNMTIFSSFIIILFLILWGTFQGVSFYYSNSNNKVMNLLAQNKIKFQEYKENNTELKKVKDKISQVEAISLRSTNVSGFMEVIGKARPDAVWLNEIKVEAKNSENIILIEGYSISKISIAEFIENLETEFSNRIIELKFINKMKESRAKNQLVSNNNYFNLVIK